MRAEPLLPMLLLALVDFCMAGVSVGWREGPRGGLGGEPVPTRRVAQQRWTARYASLPLSFEPNQGQADRRVKFLARGQGYTVFLTDDEAVLSLRSQKDNGQGTKDVLRMKLVGANRAARATALDELPGKSNYFIGNDPKKWRTHVPTYRKLNYEGVYPGVDLVYYGSQGKLEYDFVVAPGAHPKAIQLAVVGAGPAPPNEVRQTGAQQAGAQQAAPLRLDASGDLVVQAEGGEVRFHKPVVYQPVGAGLALPKGAASSAPTAQNRKLLDGRYVLTADNRIHFEVPKYDKRRPLIIDPVLSYSTYLGGSGGDSAYGIAVDASGNAYVTGSTASTNFLITSAEQNANAGNGDVFVTKFNATGSALVYSTYLGGSGSDTGTAIAVDSSGNAYITGSTLSPNFPITTSAFQTTYGGNGDAFLTKLSDAGSALVYSSYLGGSAADSAQAIALDSSGNAYVTGSTQSDDFPTASPLQIGNDGCTVVNNVTSCTADAFATKFNPSGTGLVYSTYLGGSNADYGRAIAVDASGNVYLAGYTSSTNFPTQSALQSANAGGTDAFVTELNATGSALLYSTYLGGSGQDRVFGLALDAAGSVYVAGDTQSTNFPTTPNAFQSSNLGQGDALVSKLAPGGSSLVYSTLLGGSGTDQGSAIALDSSGKAYVTGFTQSSDFPTLDPLQRVLGISGAGSCTPNLCADAFVTELNPSGAPVYSTYLGGTQADFGNAIAVDSSGNAFVAGSTASPNFPAIGGALESAYAGAGSSSNAFVAKVAPIDAPGMALTPQQVNFGNQALNSTSEPRAVTVINAGSAELDITSITAGSDFAQTNTCGTAVPPGGTCAVQITFTPTTTTGARTDQIVITDNAAGSPHTITVTGSGVPPGGSLTPSPTSLSFATQTIGTTSAAQTVRLTNSGHTSVSLTAISITGDFSQTNTCGTLPTFLNVGSSCTVSVTFTPAGSGSRTGSLTISDDAVGSPQTVALTGTANPEFSLSANVRSTSIVIGTTSTTFTVAASAPSSFTSSIALTCSSPPSGASCAFDPSSINAGQTSTLTVSGLSATTSNPANLTVSGASGSQTATLALTIFLTDFSVAVAPPLDTISSGQPAAYKVTVTPSNGFNQVVLLSCSNPAPETTCAFAPPGLTLNGTTAATATLTVTTTKFKSHSTRRPSPHGMPPTFKFKPWALWLLALALLAASIATRCKRGAMPRRLWTQLRFAALGLALFLFAIGTGCVSSPKLSGTTPGNYIITITGTLGSNDKITHKTTVNLSVGL